MLLHEKTRFFTPHTTSECPTLGGLRSVSISFENIRMSQRGTIRSFESVHIFV